MKLCSLQALPLDSRVRGNDGSSTHSMASSQVMASNQIIPASDVILSNNVILANAGIHTNNRGIRPESLPPAEDVKKIERRLASAQKKALKNPDRLEGK